MGIPEYVKVTYKSKEYCVCKIKQKDSDVLFVIDNDDLDRVLLYSWYKITHRYIATSVDNKTILLHRLIMNKIGKKDDDNDDDDDDTNLTIDHKNRIFTDNRKSNIHEVTKSEQNINKKGKNKSSELPKDGGISIDDIPKFVWYSKSRGKIGEYFEVRINTIPGMDDIHWCSTSASDLSLKFKLEHAKKYLRSLRDSKPDIFKSRLQYYSD